MRLGATAVVMAPVHILNMSLVALLIAAVDWRFAIAKQLWDEALSFFYSARLSHGGDGPVEFYIRRIEQLRQGLASLDWSNARF